MQHSAGQHFFFPLDGIDVRWIAKSPLLTCIWPGGTPGSMSKVVALDFQSLTTGRELEILNAVQAPNLKHSLPQTLKHEIPKPSNPYTYTMLLRITGLCRSPGQIQCCCATSPQICVRSPLHLDLAGAHCNGHQTLGVPFWVPMIRTALFWGLHWVPLFMDSPI